MYNFNLSPSALIFSTYPVILYTKTILITWHFYGIKCYEFYENGFVKDVNCVRFQMGRYFIFNQDHSKNLSIPRLCLDFDHDLDESICPFEKF